jgi:hypothetical protein
MHYSVINILSDVMVVLDQNNSSLPLLVEGDSDTLNLYEIIESKICEAVQRVHMEAPVSLLNDCSVMSLHDPENFAWYGDDRMGIVLDEGFMRLISFQMSSWERPVHDVITPADPLYAKQFSRYAGIRGNKQKPVCAITIDGNGDKVLEVFSPKGQEDTVRVGYYIEYPKFIEGSATGEVQIDIASRCYKSVIYMIAALVATVYGDSEKSATMVELSRTSMASA